MLLRGLIIGVRVATAFVVLLGGIEGFLAVNGDYFSARSARS
jgi:hypothetical protein